MRPLGLHTSVAGGLSMGLRRGHDLGCTTVQIFSRNPRGWTAHPLTDKDINTFKSERERTCISPVFIHTAYLLNIASPDETLRMKSINALREEMRRADSLGVEYVVMHTGVAHDAGGRERASRSIREALAGESFSAGLLLENTSGKRGDLTPKVTELAELFHATGGLAAGVCIDSCHAFAAGYDMRERDGIALLDKEIRELLPEGAVRLVHLNDSKGATGSGTDRHEHIGEGRIGIEGLRAFLSAEAFRNAPIVLETPKDSDDDDLRNLATVRELIS